MSGDAAGMITPLCGNGMAMAIHSSKILSELLIPFCLSSRASRDELEKNYMHAWNTAFATRLWIGRQFQNLFGATLVSNMAVGIVDNIKPLARYLVSKSHGSPF
jgi:flavin-dependent dehydrogenase